MMMQTWRSDEETGLSGKGKDTLRLEKWYKTGLDYGSPFKEIFATMDPKSFIWHNRLGYWPTKPWDSDGLVTLMGDAAHPMTFRKMPIVIFPYIF
jgi:2-polyprenyl-6-methoxyphenol hydroxylase-like FAD-dependent oxidoreductase